MARQSPASCQRDKAVVDLAQVWRHNNAMDLTPYLDDLRRELLAAAGAGDAEASALAERLTAAVVSATRLTMLDVLSAAADEITRDLVPGSVEVRLRGRNPSFAVVRPDGDDQFGEEDVPPTDTGTPDEALPASLDGPVGRINFRPPEGLKAQIEAAAAKDGLSVNAWLIRATATAVTTRAASGRRDSGPTRQFVGWAG
jgi:hypothetical protein